MKVVILAGGRGTRLSEETTVRPKPMVEIGGKPILWHIMKTYAHHGFNEFVIALGYKGDMIKQYFLNFYALNSDLTVKLRTGGTRIRGGNHPDWTVHLIETGLNTATGGRLKRLKPILQDGAFMMTYGDGVANVNIRELARFHKSRGRLATVTAVRPPARFGGLIMDGDTVAKFSEKPQTGEGWINGGFFVLEPETLDYIEGDDSPWEHTPLERLSAQGQLGVYAHDGFWQPMDTLREQRLLESLWESGEAPWKVWKD